MAPSTNGAQCVVKTTTWRAGHTITHSFLADLPDTITYHARDGGDRACSLAGGQGIQAGSRVRTDAGRDVRVRHIHAGPSSGAAKHDVVNVPRTDECSATGGRVRTEAGHGLVDVPRRKTVPAAGIAVALPWWSALWSRGMACAEAQMMANCPAIYYLEAEYDGSPAVQGLLQQSALALAMFISGICGRRDPDMRLPGDGPVNVLVGGRPNPHVSRAPYFPTP